MGAFVPKSSHLKTLPFAWLNEIREEVRGFFGCKQQKQGLANLSKRKWLEESFVALRLIGGLERKVPEGKLIVQKHTTFPFPSRPQPSGLVNVWPWPPVGDTELCTKADSKQSLCLHNAVFSSWRRGCPLVARDQVSGLWGPCCSKPIVPNSPTQGEGSAAGQPKQRNK